MSGPVCVGRVLRSWTALVCLFVLAAFASPALATDYAVSKISDTNDGVCNVDCSLREAIIAANANPGADRIVLGSGLTYTLSLAPADVSGALTPGTGDLDITGALTIDGNGSTLNAAGIDRALDIQGNFTVTINNLTITGGVASGFLSLGGGLNIRGATVVLNNCTVTGNATAAETGVRDDGGGIAVIGSYNAATATATLAGLTLNNTAVSNNTGSTGGGIVCVLCSLAISSSAISGNVANGGDGGGIAVVGNSSTLAISSSALVSNAATGGTPRGGALSTPFGSSGSTLTRNRITLNTAATGSAIFNSIATITATNDWWGCNYGPGAGGAGCAGTPNGISGAVTTSPYLLLKASAFPSTILLGGASAVTADLTVNSSSLDTSSGGSIPNGTVAAFSGTLGTFATPSAPTTNGKATDVYTAGGIEGTASVNALVDGQTVSASIAVTTCATITLSSTAFPNGTTGVPYPPTTITQSGGVGTTTFAVTGGALPAGMVLSSAGTVSGTPSAIGTFNFTVTATGANGCTGSGAYALTIGPPTVSLDRTALQFAATSTGATFTQQTPAQTVHILQSGTGPVTWTATPSDPWITVSPASGSGSATLAVGVAFSGGLPVSGTAAGTIALTFAGAGNTAGPIAVGLTLVPTGGSTSPFGVFDTPLDGVTGVTGSLPVTGWALDDLDVQQVRILRDPVAGEGPSQIFIGTGVFVDGARPDVAALHPTLPHNTRAGWGYLLLTNFLPNQGNGTFTLHAIADDVDGHSVSLGSRTITCANATATLPFGAIDTPGQGETISGTSYNNFGWVLARGPALAYPPYGTVSLVIDGVFGPSPAGWVSRADLTALFPVDIYPGVTNAAGVYTFDTTTLANGVHTIAWVVTTDTGQADGVGSRFFTVANGSTASMADPDSARSLTLDAPALMPVIRAGTQALGDEVNAAPPDDRAVMGRRGYVADAPMRALGVDAQGRATLSGEELDRIELHLGDADPQTGAAGIAAVPSAPTFTGYVRAGDDLLPLPIGSHLDPATGLFTWQPGVGFVKSYDLVFVRWNDGRVVARREVRIVLNPKSTGRVAPEGR